MESIRLLFKIGPGPSSSHTIGPKRICDAFIKEYPDAFSYLVELYGSLSLTGKGHLTDYIIRKAFEGRNVEVVFKDTFAEEHPNTMDLFTFDKEMKQIGYWRAYSIGGGDYLLSHELNDIKINEVYPHRSMKEIIAFCKENNYKLNEYVYHFEPDIRPFLSMIIDRMFDSIRNGLNNEGKLPGNLKLNRVAKKVYQHALELEDSTEKDKLLLSSYAYAVSEENASAGEIVTAPTCGSSGVVPAVLYHFHTKYKKTRDELIDALAVAGIIGNLVKKNATISGAIGGCQAEIGTACSMAAGAAAHLFGLDIEKIEYAAEVAMEHHLGLTCDSVQGYVQVPCIERNGVAALRAIDAALYAKHIGMFRKNIISFDDVIEAMASTGKDLSIHYKETSLGGLAKYFKPDKTNDEN